MSDGTRAAKRARNSPEPRPTIQCADDLWLSDGNIVLRALSSTSNSYHVFRVHKSVLSMHSTVFRDMFENDAVFDASSEQYAGTPLIDLHDEGQDLEDFLRSVYYSNWLYRHLNPALHSCTMYDYPKMYAGAIRLARKYDARKIIDAFASGLRKVFPSKYDEALHVWSSYRQDERPTEEDENKTPIERKQLLLADLRTDSAYPDAAHAIRLAVDLEITDVLPAAFYYLCAGHSMLNIIEEGYQNFEEVQYVGDLDVLRADELRTCLRGSGALRTYLFVYSLKKDEPPSRSDFPEERKHNFCYEEVLRMRDALALVHKTLGAASVQTFTLQSAETMSEHSICRQCAAIADQHIRAKGREMWRKLPALFDLESYGVAEGWGE
ncbi:hypothetical protein PENSPDRAFT_692592 [Peniophora sp. CONT]|nr:hypothetical protein PENSPDRAFT_692592 [Peniophora sp. CONT]